MKVDPFTPFTQWGKLFEAWQKMSEDSFTRMAAFLSEVDKAEAKRLQQAEAAIDEIARLQKETLAYSAQLGADFRKMTLDAMQSFTSFAGAANAA